MSDDTRVLWAWLASIDVLSYYEILGVSPDATPDALRAGFHAFAAAFHPDVHGFREPEAQAAVGRIFRRGTEAYRVLSEPPLRATYDAALAAGVVRPDTLSVPPPAAVGRASAFPPAGVSVRVADRVTPAARPFVLRAEELLQKGDPRQAKLQVTMACHHDPTSPELAELRARIEAAVKGAPR